MEGCKGTFLSVKAMESAMDFASILDGAGSEGGEWVEKGRGRERSDFPGAGGW